MDWIDTDYEGFEVLSELLLLALRLSCILPSHSDKRIYQMEDLVQVFRTKEEALAYYERFVAQVIQAGDDLLTHECEPSLRIWWMCCPKHRFLFVERLIIADWLHHIFEAWTPQEEYEAGSKSDYLVNPPSKEEMQQRLAALLAQTFSSPQDWLHARFVFATQAEQEHWYQPVKYVCQRKHHDSLLCCTFHTALNVIWYLFSAWLEHYNDLYQMRSMTDERGYTPGLFSPNGIALLVHLARLDTNGIPFPARFQRALEGNIGKFHRMESDGQS
jgi:hypothetical protein